MSREPEASPGAEGVIRFHLDFRETPLAEAGAQGHDLPFLVGLDGWRSVLRRLGLVGRDPDRYGGDGFGNLSHRMVAATGMAASSFVVSGSQTGDRESLGQDGWSLVRSWDLDEFRVEAEGPVRPSSESLTHALIYDMEPDVHCVVHAHSPDLWRSARDLELPRTSSDVDYGSPEMLREVRSLFSLGLSDVGVFAMAGHEDGVVAFGADADDACTRLLTHLARALAPE